MCQNLGKLAGSIYIACFDRNKTLLSILHIHCCCQIYCIQDPLWSTGLISIISQHSVNILDSSLNIICDWCRNWRRYLEFFCIFSGYRSKNPSSIFCTSHYHQFNYSWQTMQLVQTFTSLEQAGRHSKQWKIHHSRRCRHHFLHYRFYSWG